MIFQIPARLCTDNESHGCYYYIWLISMGASKIFIQMQRCMHDVWFPMMDHYIGNTLMCPSSKYFFEHSFCSIPSPPNTFLHPKHLCSQPQQVVMPNFVLLAATVDCHAWFLSVHNHSGLSCPISFCSQSQWTIMPDFFLFTITVDYHAWFLSVHNHSGLSCLISFCSQSQ